MKLTSASFQPYFIATSSATCGLCHKTINPGSIAHGHTWHSHSVIDAKIVSTDKIRDLFHRTCIQKSLSAGFETCPNCNCTVLNAEEYNKKHDFNKTKLAIQENRLFFIEHVRKRNLLALEQLLQTQSISHPFQYEALWMAVYTNDFELTKLLLFANQNAIPPIHLSLLLN